MSERFFSDAPITGTRATLQGDEARHLAAVMRAAVGDEVVLFDGSGAEFVARVQNVRKQTVELEIVERREVSRELPRSLTLAVALPKGERQKWLVEKATELGVAAIIPLVTERGIAQPVEAALDRLRRSVIEACKQCGRNRLLEIHPPQGAAELFQATSYGVRLIAEPGGIPISTVSPSFNLEPEATAPPRKTVASGSGLNEAIVAAIGPEGGFTPAESECAAANGWQAVSLGPAILRVETAAIAVAAWAATTGFLVDPELRTSPGPA